MKNGIRNLIVVLALSGLHAVGQTSGNWTQLMPQPAPPSRIGPLLAYDTSFKRLVLFGGENDNNPLNDTWTWDGTNWASISTTMSPPAQNGQSMTYDAARNQVVLLGTDSSTWVWNGFNWMQKSPQTSPPPRSFAAMTFDSVRNQVVLFGGFVIATSGSLQDTWLWDGTNWTQQFPQTVPLSRSGSAMAFDSAHGQAVLFSGRSNRVGLFTDTWVWDGTNWTQKSPQTSPDSLQDQAMAYDTAHSQIVMFGGFDLTSNSVSNQTWIWDGANWTLQKPLASPPRRDDSGMAYDSGHGQIVLFGGTPDGFTLLGDTWTWTVASAAAAPMITSVISASGFGGFSSVAPGSWVEIYGSNLAPDTRQWAGSDFNGSNAPTVLDHVQVAIGNQSAFIDYISSGPGQINAQLPSNIAVGGQLPVTVTNGTQTSAAFNVNVKSVVPGLLAPSSFLIGGKQYVVALFSDNVTYVLPTGAIPGVASRPAKPARPSCCMGSDSGQ